ncbi:MAG TPA: 30S ribosomal protein S20 [Firmicutes bacterium]|nr:30S ribosomal protein S20 [Bacillota bacterium]
MPNIKSAAKRARQNIKREQRNRRVKSMVKTAIRHFEESLQGENLEEARIKLNSAVRRIDKAAARGIIHKNNAARKKSRLNRLLNNKTAV